MCLIKAGASAHTAGITDTVFALDEIVVRNIRLYDFAVGTSSQTVDTFILQHYRNQSLADLLSAQTAISVNTYGPNGLASISHRGGGTRHTSLIWNGFDLKNSMNANPNYSTLPVCFIDGLIIQNGGASTLFGSGAATGSIHMNNTLRINHGSNLSVGTSIGSFGTFDQSGSVFYSTNNVATATRFIYQQGLNNFKYTSTSTIDRSRERLEHAGYRGYGIMQQNAFRLTDHSIIRSDIWYQKYSKDIPSLMSDAEPGNTSQLDENLRAAINMAHSDNKLLINIRSGLFLDKYIYTGPELIPDEAFNRSVSLINEAEVKYLPFKNHKFHLGLNYTYETAEADGYSAIPQRNRASIYGSYKTFLLQKRLVIVLNARQEVIDGLPIPFVYSAGTEISIGAGFQLKFNGSKNYMLPTFNDLYWAPSAYAEGNPTLKPESGYSIEGSLRHSAELDRLSFSNEITVYNTIFHNWIMWMPDSTNIWKPNNFKHGHSAGIEFTGELGFKTRQLAHKINYLYTYVNARVKELNNLTLTNEDKSVIYVPKHKANLNYYLRLNHYSLTSSFSFYSKRNYNYINKPLDPYFLASISVSRNFTIKSHSLELNFKVNNLTNSTYQVMSGYAMPPRNYMIGLFLKLNK